MLKMKKYKIKENNFNLLRKVFIVYNEDKEEDIGIFNINYIGSHDHLEDISRYFLSWFPIKIPADWWKNPLSQKYKAIFLR